jgi:protein-tyrosine phosphatase
LGNAVLIHCNAGLGRSGLVASILLKEMTNESNPIEYVRNFRKGAVENQKQEKFISNWQMITV